MPRYASYATIFNPQTEFDADNGLLDPVTGDNIEAGLKGEWMGGRLFASAAVFRANQKNTAEAAGFDATLGRIIYTGVDAKSEGVEFEIAPLASGATHAVWFNNAAMAVLLLDAVLIALGVAAWRTNLPIRRSH